MGRKRGGGWITPLLVVVGLLAVLDQFARSAVQVAVPDYARDQPFADDLDVAVQALRARGPKSASDGWLEVLHSGRQVSAADVLRIAGIQQQASAFFTYDIDGRDRATASAMGTDWRHHIVNGYLVGYRPFEAANVLEPLQVLALRKRYQYDHLQYAGRQEVWQTSEQAFVAPKGDCEDHALALADWLIEQGEDARVVLGQYRGGGHAWVVLLREGQAYLLEATRKQGVTGRFRYPLASLETDYHPEMMFNRHSFWVNTGSRLTTDYQGARWQRRSQFTPGTTF